MNLNSSQQKKLFSGVLIAALVSLIVSISFLTGILDRLENMTYDYRMKQHRQDVSMHEDIKPSGDDGRRGKRQHDPAQHGEIARAGQIGAVFEIAVDR